MNRLLFAAAAFVCIAAMGLGLYVVGGPGHARMVRDDLTRVMHLDRLSNYYRCAQIRQQQGDGVSPNSCRSVDGPPPDLRDPVSDAPYDASVTKDTISVCAVMQTRDDFEVTQRTRTYNLDLDGRQICVNLVREGALWLRGKAQIGAPHFEAMDQFRLKRE